MELYVERGFEQTTVADIAERAGVTARTFFRHYADKREVLFSGSIALQEAMVAALDAAPAEASALDAVAAALDMAADLIGTNRAHSQQRYSVIIANTELQERELSKMASLSAALADGLRRRGVPDPQAGLAAEAGIAVFRVGFEQWATTADDRTLNQILRDSLAQLRALTS
ncbi:TetR family transcriptional regulator, partial [Jatrophihabitans sp.]|uniref:TetR family transcriptional regulator n=1 Tax=Jatrophihabitans sp. TaxID=1932789 RepID=UPI0030C65BFE|nr:regulatory protein TetR [Jatrophihabitans sp.]